mmetsp:Transcript_32616/g.85397  ORF Transcript_32616/g.85397 Transcript_32616/m.85397 type:complete len:309 (+) Transcript_32616:2127-3053(+)
MRMAKSPISCGTSCSKMATNVIHGAASGCRKTAPSVRPSVKLCAKSAARLRYPATLMSPPAGALAASPSFLSALPAFPPLLSPPVGLAGGAAWEWPPWECPCPPSFMPLTSFSTIIKARIPPRVHSPTTISFVWSCPWSPWPWLWSWSCPPPEWSCGFMAWGIRCSSASPSSPPAAKASSTFRRGLEDSASVSGMNSSMMAGAAEMTTVAEMALHQMMDLESVKNCPRKALMSASKFRGFTGDSSILWSCPQPPPWSWSWSWPWPWPSSVEKWVGSWSCECACEGSESSLPCECSRPWSWSWLWPPFA